MPYGFMPETQPDPHFLMRLLEQQRKQGGPGLVSTQVDPVTGEFNPMNMPPIMGMPAPTRRQPSALARIMGGILGPQQNYGGMLGEDDLKAARQRALLAMGASLLSGSGPSPVKRGTGELIGNAMMTGMQAQDQASQDMLQAMLLRTKLQKLQQKETGPQGVQSTVIGDDGFYYTVDRLTGKMTNTGVKAAPNMRIVEQEGNTPFGVVVGRGPAGHIVGLGNDGTLPPTTVPSAHRAGPIRTPTAGERARDIASAQAGVELATKPDITRATEIAKTEAERTATLPGQLADIQKMRENIEGLVNSPGFSRIYGKSRYVGGTFPGTAGADSEARRLQLDAQAFQEAIQKMHGLGALSNAEGSKVSAAYTRATNTDQTEEAAKEAWNEVLGSLRLAEERLRMGVRVNGAASSGPAGQAAQPGRAPRGSNRSREDILKQYGL